MRYPSFLQRKTLLFIAASAGCWGGSLVAAVWTGGASGAFNSADNWDSGQVPSAELSGTGRVADVNGNSTVILSSGDALTPTHLYTRGGGKIWQTGGTLTLFPGAIPTEEGIQSDYAVNSAIGYNSAGAYEMSGGNLIVNGTGNFRIGHNASGNMRLSGTAAAAQNGSGGNLYIGSGSGTSTLTLSDSVSWTVEGSVGGDSLVMGVTGSAKGILALNDSATFAAAGNIKIGATGTSGEIHLNGGTLQVAKIWRAGGTATINATGGHINATRDRATSSGFFENLTGVKLSGAGLTFNTSGYTVWQGTGFSGEGNFTKTGAGTFVLNKSNSHGNSLVAQGTLKVIDGGTLGFGAVANNGTLTFDRSTDLNVGNAISGSGNLVKTGSGTVTLGGANTYTGSTVIENGTLRLQSALPAHLEIMPMGDSITRGSNSGDAGYRGPLYTALTADGVNFTFVGNSTFLDRNRPGGAGPSVLPDEQRHHEGHGGYVINDLLGNLDGRTRSTESDGNADPGYWLTGNSATGQAAQNPDVILLMVGTNDIQIHGLSGIDTKLHNLINKITELRPDTKLIVAEITPRTDSTERSEAVDTYNEIVRQQVAAFQAAGKNVELANMNDGFPANGLSSDKLHPQMEGYAWMAEQWEMSLLDQYNVNGVSENLPTGTAVSIASAGTLDLNGNQATIASLSGAGRVLLGGGKLIVNRSEATAIEFSGVISGNGDFVKIGTGTQILSGINTYTGATTVAEGKLVVNGSLASAMTSVVAGASLGGMGNLAGDLQVSGKLAPGSSPGVLTVEGDVSLASTAVLEIVIRSVSEYSQLLLDGGELTLAEGVRLNVVLEGFSFEEGVTFQVIKNAGKIQGASSVLADGKILEVDGHQFRIEHVTDGINLVSVPEPSTYAYMLGGVLALAGVMALRRR